MRLGSGELDAQEIKEHPFFCDVNWAELSTGKVPPPWVPSMAGSLDTSQFDQEFTSMLPIGKWHCHSFPLSFLTKCVLALTSLSGCA